MSQFFRAVLATVIVAGCAGPAFCASVTVAVASNFADTAEKLGREYERTTRNEVVLVRGSSGKLFAQIVNGAPIDVFLSADRERPLELLQHENRDARDAFVYAIGELIIWSSDPGADGSDCSRFLQTTNRKIALANPRLAPYGLAAQQFLEQASLWERLQPQLVYGENVSQALQFAASGNAAVGLVARSQLQNADLPATTCRVDVPHFTHAPIEQVGMVTGRGLVNPAATDFVAFMQSETARSIIRASGYRVLTRSTSRIEDSL